MIPTWNWVNDNLYIVAIYGSQYYTVLAYQVEFQDVVTAIVEKGQESGVNAGAPLNFITVGYISEGDAGLLEDEQLVNLVVRG